MYNLISENCNRLNLDLAIHSIALQRKNFTALSIKIRSQRTPLNQTIHSSRYQGVCNTIDYYWKNLSNLRRFGKYRAKKVFKQFIDMPGQLIYDGKIFTVKI